MESTLSVDLSTGTGYLQDAIVAWNNRCKRRRISPFCHDNIDEFSKNCWNSMDYEDPFVKFESLRENYSPVAEKNCCVIKKVVYPFEMVKPGSNEGDVTLNDINKRMLMRPTRPVMHPVGDFACRPCVTASGLGLSGKAVVALTRIRTRGSGTVTIIRTRG
ncbi:protein XRI1-like isoform X2 [Macadamia integrifolia]|uniref:protein XRI1-like isoform X2 n=1 Tax=Macadamia integrifolia TaxID=60698 RepID=UPI001C4F660E|nr:protein XRI1-like isoform X2 [Macadamia integrifolia]